MTKAGYEKFKCVLIRSHHYHLLLTILVVTRYMWDHFCEKGHNAYIIKFQVCAIKQACTEMYMAN